jgi:hypothetical protein
MALKIYLVACAVLVAFASIATARGYYPTYGMFSGEGSRRPGAHGGPHYYHGGTGFHAK